MDPVPSPLTIVAGVVLPLVGLVRRRARSEADRTVPTLGERVEGAAKPAVAVTTVLAANTVDGMARASGEAMRIVGVLATGAMVGAVETGVRASTAVAATIARTAGERTAAGIGLTVDGADAFVGAPIRLVAGALRLRAADAPPVQERGGLMAKDQK